MIIAAVLGSILSLIFDYTAVKVKKQMIVVCANIVLEIIFIAVIAVLLVKLQKDENISEHMYFRICNYFCTSISSYLYIQQCIDNLLHNNGYFYSTMLKTLAYSIPQLVHIDYQNEDNVIQLPKSANQRNLVVQLVLICLLLMIEILKIVIKHNQWLVQTKGVHDQKVNITKEICGILIFLIHNVLLCTTKQIIYNLEQDKRKIVIISCCALCFLLIVGGFIGIYKMQKKQNIKEIYLVVEIANYCSIALMLPMIVTKNYIVIIITYIVNAISIIATLFLFTTLVSRYQNQIINSCLLDLSVNLAYDISTIIFTYTEEKITMIIVALLSVSLLVFDLVKDENKHYQRKNYNQLLQSQNAKKIYYRLLELSQAKIQ